jgi:HK97 family phage prohead protease
MDKKLKREINLQVSGLCVRETEDGQKSRTVEGYAVVFGVRSVNLTPWSSDREVYEIMEPGSITPDLLSRSDVVLTAFHNNQMILGRWRMGKGTLTLELDQRGLKIRCTLAETATADELLAAIERGDITGMSFAFTADEEDNVNGVVYEKTSERAASGKVVWLRHVKKVTGLYDVTIAGHPAYEQTTIEARELNDLLEEKLRECGGEDDDKRGCGGDDDDKRDSMPADTELNQGGGMPDPDPAVDEAAKKAKEEQEARELAEREQKEREAVAVMRMRRNRLALQNRDIETFSY